MSTLVDRTLRSTPVRALRARAQQASERRLVRRAVDITAETAERSALIFAPHPDDEALGCGVTIMRKRDAGTRVYVVVATDGRTSHRSQVVTPDELGRIRSNESIEACRMMRVEPSCVELLGHPRLRDVPALDDQVDRAISELSPDEVFVPSRMDRHPDHVALNLAVHRSRALRQSRLRVLEYPIWFWRVIPWVTKPTSLPDAARRLLADPLRTLPKLRPQIVSTDGYLTRKRDTLRAYRSQMTNLTAEPGWQTFDPAYLQHFLKPFEMFFAAPGTSGR